MHLVYQYYFAIQFWKLTTKLSRLNLIVTMICVKIWLRFGPDRQPKSRLLYSSGHMLECLRFDQPDQLHNNREENKPESQLFTAVTHIDRSCVTASKRHKTC